MTCRDRNRLAQQSDILGAYAAGVENVLCLTGDYQSFGSNPDAKGVFDLDSVQLINIVADMNDGKLMSRRGHESPAQDVHRRGGEPVRGAVRASHYSPGQENPAGAQFIQTQPVFDFPQIRQVDDRPCGTRATMSAYSSWPG